MKKTLKEIAGISKLDVMETCPHQYEMLREYLGSDEAEKGLCPFLVVGYPLDYPDCAFCWTREVEVDVPKETPNRQIRNVTVEITLPMDYPADWDDDMINFHLNESSWCFGNFLGELNKYANEHNGCICNICVGKVQPKE